MLWGVAAALLSLVLITSPAQAEFPAALSAWAGAGAGWGHREEVSETGSLFGYVGIESAWRFAPGRALVAAYEGAGGPIGGSKALASEGSSHLDNLEHFAITVGPEFSFPPGSGMAFFCRGSAGVGRVTTDGFPGMGTLGSTSLTENGFALSGAGGLRLLFPPGPLGLTISLHAAQTFAHHSSCGGVGVTFGMALYPLDRRQDP